MWNSDLKKFQTQKVQGNSILTQSITAFSKSLYFKIPFEIFGLGIVHRWLYILRKTKG